MCNEYLFKTKPLTDYFCYQLTSGIRPSCLAPEYLLRDLFVLDHLCYPVTAV
ncbi:hypothetical protein F4776DRAFT_600412 [Hypoxylon sp. NC0597]|nr:hypothetical protein F4776DRAFT_600412 [Hypoxylon sp. NC0597]